MSVDNDVYRWYADVIVYRGFGPLIACLGIVGGTLSLLVFRRKSLRKKSCSIYFLYLALADLLCMICWLVYFVLPLYHINILIFSNFFCKIFIFSMYFAFDLANYILAVCSIDRAVSVLFPIQSRRFCRPRIAHLITFLFIIINGLLNGHLLYGFAVLSIQMNSTESSIKICTVRNDSKRYLDFFHIYDSYVDVIKTNIIPFIIMSICNVIIILRVCRSNSSLSYARQTRCRKSKKKFEKDRQLTLMLVGSVIAFLVLTLPTEINDIIRTHSPTKLVTEKDYLFSAILLSFAYLNYAVHFYIYTLTGEVFRQQLIKLWPIDTIRPYMIALLRCKRSSESIDDDATTTRRRCFDKILTPNPDISLVTTKFNDENDSFIS